MKTIKINTRFEEPENFTGIIEYTSGNKRWFFMGQLHRLDGPAVVLKSGHKEYWIYDKEVTKGQQELLYNMMKLKELI